MPDSVSVDNPATATVIVTDPDPGTVLATEFGTALVRELDVTVITTDAPTLVVQAPAPRGPAGPPGPAGAAYLHTQSAPAATWTIPHTIGRLVHVSLLDDAGAQRFADVEQIVGQVSVTYPAPTTGYALLG